MEQNEAQIGKYGKRHSLVPVIQIQQKFPIMQLANSKTLGPSFQKVPAYYQVI